MRLVSEVLQRKDLPLIPAGRWLPLPFGRGAGGEGSSSRAPPVQGRRRQGPGYGDRAAGCHGAAQTTLPAVSELGGQGQADQFRRPRAPTSALSKPNFWVERLQLATGIADFHLPVDAALRIVDVG